MKLESILPIFLLITSTSLVAQTFTFTGTGEWDDTTLWSPSYPGLSPSMGQTIVIDGTCNISVGVTNNAELTVMPGGGLCVATGAPIFVNGPDGLLYANGPLVVLETMYNQGYLEVNDQLYVPNLFLNFGEWVNNELVIAVGSPINSIGNFNNQGTYVDNGGFFNQGGFVQGGTWAGTTDFMNTAFTNDGVVSPGNSPGFTAGYTFFQDYIDNGLFEAEINGTGGNGDLNGHDWIMVNGSAVLSGDLTVTLEGGFEPDIGDSFELLTSLGGISGDYSNVDLPVLSSGKEWSYVNNGTNIRLEVVAPLPVKLSYFKATLEGEMVRLDWESLLEVDHFQYIIERSTDSKDWQQIGRIRVEGNSYEAKQYSYLDKQATQGLNYYRLVSEDISGGREVSDVVSMKITKEREFKLYPNVMKLGQISSLRADGVVEGDYQLECLDSGGNIILNGPAKVSEGSLHVDFGLLSAGSYFIRLRNEDMYFVAKVLVF